MEMKLFLVVAAGIVSACSGCEDTWPVGTEIHTEAMEGTRPAQVWHDQVKLAMIEWQSKLGEDCEFPYTLIDAPSGNSHAIRLVPPDEWTGPDHSTGAWYDDGAIIVKNKSNATYVIYTVMHELGHAMSGGWHSEEEGDLMYWKGSDHVTKADAQRMRESLGCE